MKILNAWQYLKHKRFWNRESVILMYHRIANINYDPRQLTVSPNHFDDHMQILRKLFVPVKLNQINPRIKRFSLKAKKVVVTLDDGYGDNFKNGKPRLERYEIPATFFIVTGVTDSQKEFWWNSLERTILSPEIIPDILNLCISGTEYCWKIKQEGTCLKIDYSQTPNGVPPKNTIISRSQLYSVLLQILSTITAEERNNVLLYLLKWSRQTLNPRQDFLPMTSVDLSALASSALFEIGAHTVNHPILSSLTIDKQKEEIYNSKKFLEDRLNIPIKSFSYPHGEYTNKTLHIVKELKFENACTAFEKTVTRNTNPLLLPRFMIMNWDGDQFQRTLRGWFDNI